MSSITVHVFGDDTLFPIPMRGNEILPDMQLITVGGIVPNPHEG